MSLGRSHGTLRRMTSTSNCKVSRHAFGPNIGMFMPYKTSITICSTAQNKHCKLITYSLLKPSIFPASRSVIVAGACFEAFNASSSLDG